MPTSCVCDGKLQLWRDLFVAGTAESDVRLSFVHNPSNAGIVSDCMTDQAFMTDQVFLMTKRFPPWLLMP